jgi:hypothetical protein
MRLRPLLFGALLTFGGVTAAMAADPPVEVRLGLLWPDLGPPSSRLPGVDANAELLIRTPLSAWTMNLPAWLRWVVAPRVNVGGAVNTAGAANQAYAGLTWTVPLASSLLHQNDGLSFGFSIGPDLIGGSAVPHGLDQGLQLRLGAEIGYQVTPRMGLFVTFGHVTGGPLLHETDNLNELGVRVGLHF